MQGWAGGFQVPLQFSKPWLVEPTPEEIPAGLSQSSQGAVLT